MPKGRKSSDPEFGKMVKKTWEKHRKIRSVQFSNKQPEKSIIEESDLTQIINNINIALDDFEDQNKFIVFDPNEKLNSSEIKGEINYSGVLRIPKKPLWDKNDTLELFKEKEQASFNAWRREISKIEVQSCDRRFFTPYEKNLEFWRELWRVLEISDILVQVVDARNPMLYWCQDLCDYFTSLIIPHAKCKKSCLLLMNKSDLLSETQRKIWSEHFDSMNIPYVFWSAKYAQINEVEKENEDTIENDKNPSPEKVFNKWDVVNKNQLLEIFINSCSKLEEDDSYKRTVGLTGFPNVGKSATLNALIEIKKSSVSATPGRTKHMQTYVLPEIKLCDCPGLVMPSVANSVAELIAAGILCIDTMRDCISPFNLICKQIPKNLLLQQYSLPRHLITTKEKFCTGLEFLTAFCKYRNILTSSGNPHLHRAARLILYDYTKGDLLYCHPPSVEDENIFNAEIFVNAAELENQLQTNDAQNNNCDAVLNSVSKFDINFFSAIQTDPVLTAGFGYRGRLGEAKNAVRVKKTKQREKLRRKFAHLDKHD